MYLTWLHKNRTVTGDAVFMLLCLKTHCILLKSLQFVRFIILQTAEDIVLDPRPEYHRAVLTWLPNSPVPRAVSTGMSELDLHRTSWLHGAE